jgi:hypothetical protein
MPDFPPNSVAVMQSGRLQVRPNDVEIRLPVFPALSADGREIFTTIAVSCRVRPAPADLAAAEAYLLDPTGRVTIDAVRDHFLAPARALFAQWCSSRQALAIVNQDAGDLSDALYDVLDRAAFAIGLELAGKPVATVECPAQKREMSVELERKHQQQAVEAHARIVAGLRDTAGHNLASGSVLRSIPRADQPAVLRNFLQQASPPAPAGVVCIGGEKLVRTDAQGAILDIVKPQTRIGPYRSITRIKIDGTESLAIGGRDGVSLIAPRSAKVRGEFLCATPHDGPGFNAVAYRGSDRSIVATHRLHGIVSWDISTGRITETVPPATLGCSAGDGPSALITTPDGTAWAIAAGRAFSIQPGRITELSDPIRWPVALLGVGVECWIVLRDGSIYAASATGLASRLSAPLGQVSTAALLCAPGLSRVLLATEAGILNLSPEDSATLLYRGPRGRPFALTAGGGTVACIHEDRATITLWRWHDEAAEASLHLLPKLGHRVADILTDGTEEEA